MRILAVLTVLAAAGCSSSGWTRAAGETRYPPTEPSAVKVVDAAPVGAEILGHVHGVKGDETAMADARRRAAALGADAMLRLASGDEATLWPFSPWSVEFVDGQALRLAR